MMRRLLADLGVDAPSDAVAIGGGERLLATPLRAAELSAAALGAQAAVEVVLVNQKEAWEKRAEAERALPRRTPRRRRQDPTPA